MTRSTIPIAAVANGSFGGELPGTEIGASFACYPNPFNPAGSSGLGTTGAVEPAFSEAEMYPEARTINQQTLATDVESFHTFVNKSSLIAYDVSGVVIMEKAPKRFAVV